MALPGEITTFFSQESARSLLIKGAPGSGKTTLALQILEECSDIRSGFYISTRVSDEALFSQFKWLKEKEWRDRLIDITKEFLREIVQPQRESVEPKVVKAKEMLSVLRGSREKLGVELRPNLLRLLKEVDLPDIENLYDRIQSLQPARCMVVIDSIDGMGEKYGIGYAKIVGALQKDLVEHTDVNLVIVVEAEGPTPIDYLVDGIITLHMERCGMSQLREMSIKKMRGVKIEHPYYLFTLLDGRFHVLEEEEKKEKPSMWEPIVCKEGSYSTGLSDVDAFVGKLLPGDVILLEVEPRVLEASMFPFILSPIANFLTQGHGVLLIPPVSLAPEHISPLIGMAGENLDRLRIFLKVHEGSEQKHIVRLPYRTCMEDYQIWLENYNELLKNSKKPFLLVIGLDTQEASYPREELREMLLQVVEHARAREDILFLVTKLQGEFCTAASAIAKLHLRLHERNGLTFLTGEKRRTGTYWVKRVAREYIEDVRLLPLL